MIKLVAVLAKLLLVLLFSLVACSPVKVVHTDGVAGFRLQQYQTFGFVEEEAAKGVTTINYTPEFGLLKAALVEQLERRGLRHTETAPDLLLNPGLVVREEVQTRETDFMTDRPRYMGQRRYHWRSEEVVVRRYNAGTISVDLVDRKRNELVWQGAVEAVVPEDYPKLQNRIRKGVSALLEKVP